MLNKISKQNIAREKENLTSALDSLNEYSISNRKIQLSQSERDGFTYLLKSATFWKRMLNDNGNSYYNQMISDFINVPKFLILGEKRALDLTCRSIIENYIRIIEHSYMSDNHVTLNVMESFRDHQLAKRLITQTDYSKIKNLYTISSTMIHGNIAGSEVTISRLITDELFPNQLEQIEISSILNNVKDVINIMRKCFIHEYYIDVFNAFYREATILEFLTNKSIRTVVVTKTLG